MKTVRCLAALFIITSLFGVSTSLFAANDASGAWTTMYKSGVLNRGAEESPWRYGVYADVRYTDRRDGINQTTLLPGIGYRINNRVSFWGGYTYFRSSVTDGATYDEHRMFEQVSWNVLQQPGTKLQSRSRLEQRFRDGRDGTDLRFRQQFRLDARFPANPDFKYILGDEIFYHFRDTAWSRQGYGQNRFYTGLGWDYNNITIEALYMHQHYRVRYLPDSANHLLVLSFKM